MRIAKATDLREPHVQLLYKEKSVKLKKKRDPITEYRSEPVNFFIILKEKNNCKKKHIKYQKEKY